MEEDKLYITPDGYVVDRIGEHYDDYIIRCWNSDSPQLGVFTSVPKDGEYVRSLKEPPREHMLAIARLTTVRYEYYQTSRERFERFLKDGN